jgi:hypothetical protein
MDDFAMHTGRRFDTVDRRFDEVDRRFDDVDRRFEDVDERLARLEGGLEEGFHRIDTRIDDLHRTIQHTLVQLSAGVVVTLALGLIGIIVTH